MSIHTNMQSGPVETWFFAWVRRHIQQCPNDKAWPVFPGGLPDEFAARFFAGWIRAFKERGIIEPVADEMSLLYAASGADEWPGTKQLNALLAHSTAAWNRVRMRETGVDLSTREGAAALARGCPECNSDGYAARDQEHDGVRYSTALFCLCPLGEWMAFYFHNNHKDVFARMRRLIQYPELWNTGFTHPSWPAQPKPRSWPLEVQWCKPWIYCLPGALPFERGKVSAAVRTVQDGIQGGPAF